MTDNLWGEPVAEPTPATKLAPANRQKRNPLVDAHPQLNPCIVVFGEGPAGAKCKTCQHFRKFDYHNKKLYKCHLRGYSHGPGTDHRVRWDACAKYEERNEAEPKTEHLG